MEKLKRLEALLLVFLIFALALVGCSSKTSNDVANAPKQNEAEGESKTESLPIKEEAEAETKSLPVKEENESKTDSLPVRWEIDDEDKSIRGKMGDTIEIPNSIYITDRNFSGDASFDFSCVSSDTSIVETLRGDEVYLKQPGTVTITLSLVVNDEMDCGSQDIEIIVEDLILGNKPYISSRGGKFLEYKDNLYFCTQDFFYTESYLVYNIDSSENNFDFRSIKISNPLENYNTYNDTIYYTEGNKIYAMDVLGDNIDDNIRNIARAGGEINNYTDSEGTKFMNRGKEISADNIREIAEVSSDEIHSMHVIDGKLYYLNTDAGVEKGHMECMSLDGEVLKKSSEYKNISDMQYYKGYLYFNARIDNSKNIRLYKTDLDFNEVEVVCDDLHEYKLYNGGIYYYRRNINKNTEKNGLYRYDMASKESTKIVDGVIGSFDILEDKIYYTCGELFNSNVLCNQFGYCNIDGSEPQLRTDDYGLGKVYSTDDKVYIFAFRDEDKYIYVFNSKGEMSTFSFSD